MLTNLGSLHIGSIFCYPHDNYSIYQVIKNESKDIRVKRLLTWYAYDNQWLPDDKEKIGNSDSPVNLLHYI